MDASLTVHGCQTGWEDGLHQGHHGRPANLALVSSPATGGCGIHTWNWSGPQVSNYDLSTYIHLMILQSKEFPILVQSQVLKYLYISNQDRMVNLPASSILSIKKILETCWRWVLKTRGSVHFKTGIKIAMKFDFPNKMQTCFCRTFSFPGKLDAKVDFATLVCGPCCKDRPCRTSKEDFTSHVSPTRMPTAFKNADAAHQTNLRAIQSSN